MSSVEDEVLDDDYVQEDEDDSDDDQLQGVIAAHHSQFAAEQAVRQEALRASRPWSAPPLMSPRPETQRAKKAEAANSTGAQGVLEALTQPRAEYEPPAQRQGFSSNGVPEGMMHLAAARPLSAGHVRSHGSGVAGTPLQDILEEYPLDDGYGPTTSRSAPHSPTKLPGGSDATSQSASMGPDGGSMASEDPQGNAGMEASVADMVPDEELYAQVGDSVSQAPSRLPTGGGAAEELYSSDGDEEQEEEEVEEEDQNSSTSCETEKEMEQAALRTYLSALEMPTSRANGKEVEEADQNTQDAQLAADAEEVQRVEAKPERSIDDSEEDADAEQVQEESEVEEGREAVGVRDCGRTDSGVGSQPTILSAPVRVPTTTSQTADQHPAAISDLGLENSGLRATSDGRTGGGDGNSGGGSSAQSKGEGASEQRSQDLQSSEHSAHSTASGLTDYGDLLHPHAFALQLLLHDLRAAPPKSARRAARRNSLPHPTTAPTALQELAAEETPAAPAADQTTDDQPTKPATDARPDVQPSQPQAGQHDAGDHESVSESHDSTEAPPSTDYGDLLHPHTFAVELVKHDLVHGADEVKGSSYVRARARGQDGEQNPTAAGRPARRAHHPTARLSAGIIARAGGRPVSAPAYPPRDGPNMAWSGHGQRSPYAGVRQSVYVNPNLRPENVPPARLPKHTLSAHQQAASLKSNPDAIALLSDDEAEVEILAVGDQDLGGGEGGDTGWQQRPASAGSAAKRISAGGGTGGTMSFAEWQRAFHGGGCKDGDAASEASGAGSQGRDQGGQSAGRPQTAPIGGRSMPRTRSASANRTGRTISLSSRPSSAAWAVHTGVDQGAGLGGVSGPAWGLAGPGADTTGCWNVCAGLERRDALRQRPATAHPLSRTPATNPNNNCHNANGAIGGMVGLTGAPLVVHPLCSTAAVDVGGHQAVSVYVADTVRKVTDANRCMAFLGLSNRYRLKRRVSSMQLEVYDSKWQPETYYGSGVDGVHVLTASDVEACAPALRQLSLNAFLTAHTRLRQQAADLVAAAEAGAVGRNRAGSGALLQSSPAVRRERPKSATAAIGSSQLPYRQNGDMAPGRKGAAAGTGAGVGAIAGAWARQRQSLMNHQPGSTGIPGVPVGGFVMHQPIHRQLSGPHWGWDDGRQGATTAPAWAAETLPGNGQPCVPRDVVQELQARLDSCEAITAKIGSLKLEQQRATRGHVV